MAVAGKQYSPTDRERGIAAYVAEGTFAGASRVTGIKANTIQHWRDRYPEEWERVTNYVRDQFEEERRAKLEEIITVGLRETLDRLRNGNVVIHPKTGEKVRIEVSARDAATVTGIMVDKLRISLGQPTNITAAKAESPQDRLKALRDEARQRAIESGTISEIRIPLVE